MPEGEILVLVPVLALLALSLLRSGKSVPRLLPAALVVLVVFSGFLLLRAAVSDEFLWPNSEVDRRTRWLQKHLTRTPDWEKRPVVILMGSSASYYGLDAPLLEKLLAEAGTPATVLSFCMPGDNHHERLYMLEVFLRKLSASDREKLAATELVLLGEVFDAYDRNPLYRIDKEAGTERAILFIHPANGFKIWGAYSRYLNESETAASGPRMAGLLIEHVLLNRFAVGAFSDMKWRKRRPRSTPPFFPLEGKKEEFDFAGTVSSLERSQGRSSKTYQLPFPQWLLFQEQLMALMDPYVDRYGLYSLPTLETGRLSYQNDLFDSLPKDPFVLPPPTMDELKPLLDESLWFDGVHPTGSGARVVTLWLAERLSPALRRLTPDDVKPPSTP